MDKWYKNPLILSQVKSLRDTGMVWSYIYDYMTSSYPKFEFLSADSMRKRFAEHNRQITTGLVSEQSCSYDEAFERLCDYIGKSGTILTPKKVRRKRKKILCMSDLHIPFHNEKVLVETVEKHSDADILLINGDFGDCYSASKYLKNKVIPLKDELSISAAILDWLASRFPEIIILSGNHTDRVRKYFSKRVDNDMMFLVDYDILELLSKDLPNVEIVKDKYEFPNGNGESEISYFKLIGEDFVVGHFEKASSIPARAAIASYQWLMNWSYYFNIQNIRLFLQGHTHRLSKIVHNHGDVVIGESGCMAKVQDYAIDSGAKYNNSHLNGYWIVYQENGVTDLNSSNFFIS